MIEMRDGNPKKNQQISKGGVGIMVQGDFFLLVTPKKYEKVLKYGTGYPRNFPSPSPFMKDDTLTFFHHF